MNPLRGVRSGRTRYRLAGRRPSGWTWAAIAGAPVSCRVSRSMSQAHDHAWPPPVARSPIFGRSSDSCHRRGGKKRVHKLSVKGSLTAARSTTNHLQGPGIEFETLAHEWAFTTLEEAKALGIDGDGSRRRSCFPDLVGGPARGRQRRSPLEPASWSRRSRATRTPASRRRTRSGRAIPTSRSDAPPLPSMLGRVGAGGPGRDAARDDRVRIRNRSDEGLPCSTDSENGRSTVPEVLDARSHRT